MNAKVQSAGKVDAAFGLKAALRIVQDEIRDFDRTATNVEVS
jgi:hypothetical protein